MRFCKLWKLICCCVVVQLLATTTWADVRLPKIFGDHMVLQQGKPLPVWGWAAAGERITVTVADKTVQVTTNKEGKWRAELPALKSGDPVEMTVRGTKNSITFKDVLIGEVWLCSGQSNMEVPVGEKPGLSWWKGVNNYKKELETASRPTMRLFRVSPTWKRSPIDDVDGKWDVCTPETAARLSGTAYFFGRRLNTELKVPVGLITAAIGGMPIEQFTPPPDQAFWYNGMIAPIIPYGIRGAIWYQGETNLWAGDGLNYFDKQKRLILAWRKAWGQGDFPFYLVQIAPMDQGDNRYGLPRFWEAQAKTLSLLNTGIASTTDIGNVHDVHPRNKQDVGKRLALLALAKNYGQDVVHSGPTFRSMKVEGDKICVSFDNVGSGLVSRNGKDLNWFEIAGDGDFVAAKAVIDRKSVIVSSDSVPRPTMVRFGWHAIANPNLQNMEGLPAYPFRTCSTAPTATGRTYFGETSAASLTCAEGNGVIRYTLDGSAPTSDSPRYTDPITLTETTTIRTRFFREDGVNSNAVNATFTKLAPLLHQGKKYLVGLRYDYYEGQWTALPDFTKLKPVESGTVEEFSLTPSKRSDGFAIRFTGYLTIKESDLYTFEVASDDGSRLSIDGQEVVNNDGIHGQVPKTGTIRLEPGMHKIAVDYFENACGEGLSISYKGSSGPRQQPLCWREQ